MVQFVPGSNSVLNQFNWFRLLSYPKKEKNKDSGCLETTLPNLDNLDKLRKKSHISTSLVYHKQPCGNSKTIKGEGDAIQEHCIAVHLKHM